MDNFSIADLLNREQSNFLARHPRSRALFESGQRHYLYGTPSHWMRRWASGFPIYVEHATGTRLRCVDGFDYVDFCLGDTGAMCGHGVAAVTDAVAQRLAAGATFMLPTPDADWVGEELTRRFGLPYWGFTTSATDANRAAIRLARIVTARNRVLVFNGCYHGAVEEAHVALLDGQVTLRNGIHPNGTDHSRLSRIVEFNDTAALEAALEPRDVACVLTEPCMTNYGMIEAKAGFLKALRDLTRRTETLLIIDETHTISAGPGGYTGRDRLEPDLFVIGKAIGGGIPVGLYGASQKVTERMWELVPKVNPAKVRQSAHLGFGGTLAGSALQVSAVRAVLSQVLTETNFGRMVELAHSLAVSARQEVLRHQLPWHIAQSGARVETMWSPTPPANATEVARYRDGDLEALLHVYFLNRGILITPFHSMLLMCPATSAADVGRYCEVFRGFCMEIAATKAITGIPA
jgi:glutamate-1-semialdehyde 2,1-aminomutase